MAKLDRLAPVAQRLIDDFGKPMELIAERIVADGPAGTNTPVPEPGSPFSVTGVIANYDRRLVGGASIQDGDQQVLLGATGLSIQPQPSHKLKIEQPDGATFKTLVIQRVERIYSGELVAVWDLQVR